MHKLSKTTLFFLALIAGSTTLTTVFGQSRFSIAPTVSAGYQRMNYAYAIGDRPDFQLTGSGTYQSVSAGLTAHYALSTHWSISAGLLYNRYKGDRKTVHVDGSIPELRQPLTIENLQLPVLLNYAGSHRLAPYLSAGVLLNYQYQSTFTNPVTGVRTQAHADLGSYNAVNIQAIVGAGVQYRFTPGISLIVQPTATYELGKPSVNYPQYRNYNLGVQTQVKFTF